MRNHYEVLDVPRDATAEQIKAAYRFQLKAFHPDKFSQGSEHARNAQERIHQIVEAYRMLSQQSSRAEYDRFLNNTSPLAIGNPQPNAAKIRGRSGRAIYVSATDELESAEELILIELASLGFRTMTRPGAKGGSDLRPAIRKQIDQCCAVIQLVGRSFGDEPPTIDPVFGRVSYTQFESLYARQTRKRVHHVLLSGQFPADRITGETKEHTDLQEAYRRRLQIVDPGRFPSVEASEDLRLNIRTFASDAGNPVSRNGVLWLTLAAAIIILIGIWFVPSKRVSPRTQSQQLKTALAQESFPPAKTDGPKSQTSVAIPHANPSPIAASTLFDSDIAEGSFFAIVDAEVKHKTPYELTLRLAVKARSPAEIDNSKAKIQVFFYDLVNRKEVVLTDREVSYEWPATSHHDWKDENPEILTVTYRKGKEFPDLRASRNYLGFVARVYYNDQLQDVRADPKTLLDLFSTPPVVPSEESGSEAAARGEYAKAAELFKKTADWGDPTGQLGLAWLYENGRGVSQDYQKAFALSETAAATGSVEGILNLARLYYQGIGVKTNYAKAAELLDQAAAQGSVEAMFRLGWLFENGKGVQRDYYVAAAFYQKAADKGHVLAAAKLGFLYQLGLGVPQDYNKAAELYQEAADRGDSFAQTNLAFLYEEGKGIGQDYTKAIALYEKAADQGDPNAQTNLGWMYRQGIGVLQDYRKAVELYQKAAAQGYAPGQAYLASLYAQGKGVPLDYRKAVDLFRAAVAQVDPNAFNDFAWFLATCPDASRRNGKEAVFYATKACEISKWKEPNFIGTLAAAYAEIGNFQKAVDYARQSLKMTSEVASKRQMERCLHLFRHRQPYRQDDQDDTSRATDRVDSIGVSEAKRLKTEADSGTADALNDFAWFLATYPDGSQRDGKKAIICATKACEISKWGDSHFMSTLAAAYAEAGQFDKAIRFAREALAVEKRISGSGAANFRQRLQMQSNLELYRNKKPYRQELNH